MGKIKNLYRFYLEYQNFIKIIHKILIFNHVNNTWIVLYNWTKAIFK
jgi:hypothetical protein